MSFLDYTFFQYALVGLVIISIAGSMIGTYITTRRMVSITGGITHACFGGLGLGYFLGLSPVITAAVFAVASALGIESLSTRYRVREDSAIAVVWSLGMAVGILFVFLTPGYVPELNSFLFGNVLTISSIDLMAFAIYTTVTALFLACFRKTVSYTHLLTLEGCGNVDRDMHPRDVYAEVGRKHILDRCLFISFGTHGGELGPLQSLKCSGTQRIDCRRRMGVDVSGVVAVEAYILVDAAHEAKRFFIVRQLPL